MLLLGLVYAAVEYRENIIFVRFIPASVFGNNGVHFIGQSEIYRLARFLTDILHTPVLDIPVFQQGVSAKLIPAPK